VRYFSGPATAGERCNGRARRGTLSGDQARSQSELILIMRYGKSEKLFAFTDDAPANCARKQAR